MRPIIRDRKTGTEIDPFTLTKPQPVTVDFLYEGTTIEGVEGTVTNLDTDPDTGILTLRIMLHHKRLMPVGEYEYIAFPEI